MITFPDGFKMSGIFGRCGLRLDQLGFNLAKVTFNQLPPMENEAKWKLWKRIFPKKIQLKMKLIASY